VPRERPETTHIALARQTDPVFFLVLGDAYNVIIEATLKAYLGTFILAIFYLGAAWASPPNVSVTFQNENLPLKMEVYEVKPESGDRIAETGIEGSLENTPVNKRVTGKVTLAPGSERSLVLVMHNPQKKPFYFFAVPHVAHPGTSSVGLHFECLCTGKIYKVPPESYWYRVVRLQSDPSFKSQNVELRHSLVGVKSEEAQGIYRKQLHETSLAH